MAGATLGVGALSQVFRGRVADTVKASEGDKRGYLKAATCALFRKGYLGNPRRFFVEQWANFGARWWAARGLRNVENWTPPF
jgi:hypothetical protein